MKIVAAGGGSGGHVTPVVAVLRELKRHDADLKAYFVTDRGYSQQAAAFMAKAPFEVRVKRIFSGKWRRYHAVSWWRQLIDIPTMLKNLRDIFLFGLGLLQSLWFLRRVKPDVVFGKGGFVCLPVGLAAKVLRIPLVIHDSDIHPGLTNRILARYATVIATGAPTKFYPYPAERTHYVGIPVDRSYRVVTARQQQACKAALGLPDTKRPLIVVTGGGLGARNLNRVVVSIAGQLLEHAAILHVTGQANYEEVLADAPDRPDYIVKAFLPEGFAIAFGAADIVITRAGATTMLELAASGKPVVIVPSPYLPGAHQIKNAAMYEQTGAAIVCDEAELIMNPLKLKHVLLDLLANSKKRAALSTTLHKFAKPDAAIDTAALIAEAAYAHTKQKQTG